VKFRQRGEMEKDIEERKKEERLTIIIEMEKMNKKWRI
jgi:hypothetical protein